MKSFPRKRSREDLAKMHFEVSEPSDFIRFDSETKLRSLAAQIPVYFNRKSILRTQEKLSRTVNAAKEFLSQVVMGLSLGSPYLTSSLLVSATGFDAVCLLTNDKRHEEDCWIEPYPVNAYITNGRYVRKPESIWDPVEPAVSLSVKRSGDEDYDDFVIEFTLTSAKDMQILSLFLGDLGDLWDVFEKRFNVEISDAILDDVAKRGCREVVRAFVSHVIPRIEHNFEEKLNLVLKWDGVSPLHRPIVAAISLLGAFDIYKDWVRERAHTDPEDAFEIIRAAVRVGNENIVIDEHYS